MLAGTGSVGQLRLGGHGVDGGVNAGMERGLYNESSSKFRLVDPDS